MKRMNTANLVNSLINTYGENITTNNINEYCLNNNVTYQTITKHLNDYKVGRGRWNLTAVEKLEMSFSATSAEPAVTVREQQNFIPSKDDTFVPFGNFKDLKKIIQSSLFYPTFITGLSGNGKTFSVEQACAQLKREMIRVNITIETDEDDLIGGFRLINGETVWHDGPVVEALRRGAVLLLDEIDLASNKILCLQSILEGKGIFLKKTGKYVYPSPGFTVFATANTKGKGSDDGRFIGTNVLNEAFLERFPITFEQDYPGASIEKKILASHCADETFVENLVRWAEVIRKSFYDGAVDELISTRRLVHIAKAFAIFNDRMKAIQYCVNRFDQDTKQSFIELYTKIDENVEVKTESEPELVIETNPPY